jgi:hypothetical protein
MHGWFQQRNTTTTSLYAKPPRDDWLPYREHEFIQSMSSRPRSFHALAQRPGKVAWMVTYDSAARTFTEDDRNTVVDVSDPDGK